MKKKGVSLIVLSITILVMAILAATAIIALEDSGIIGRSKNTTTKQNEQQEYTRLQVIKNGILTDNLGEITIDEYIQELKNKGIIEDSVITSNGNKIVTTKSGLEVYLMQDGKDNIKISFEAIQPGLGDLITADNYGESVDYEVTVNGTTYGSWKILYHNDDYVYLIISDVIGEGSINSGVEVKDLTESQKSLYKKFQVGNGTRFTLTDTIDGEIAYNCQGIAQLIDDFGAFANTRDYGTNVLGAIGGPTIELLAASWNAVGRTPQIKIQVDKNGYGFNHTELVDFSRDGFYIFGDEDYGYLTNCYWVASPYNHYTKYAVVVVGNNCITDDIVDETYGFRPVVCLKASIHAAPEGEGADWGLIK